MKKKLLFFLLISFLNLISYAKSDKNWFCVQRLVANISKGTIWRYGHNETFDAFNNNSIAVSTLIKNTANDLLTKQDKQYVASIIKKFSKQTAGDNIQLVLLFAYTLKELRQQKQQKIDYILNYGRNHQTRVKILQATRNEIRQAIKANDTTKLANLEEQYKWQVAVFNARKKHNPHLCQGVVDVDAYAFSLATEIGKYIEN